MELLLDQLAPILVSALTALAAIAIAYVRKRLQVEDGELRARADALLDRVTERHVRAVEKEAQTREKKGQGKMSSEEKHDRADRGIKDDLAAVGGTVGKVALEMAKNTLPGRITGLVGKLF